MIQMSVRSISNLSEIFSLSVLILFIRRIFTLIVNFQLVNNNFGNSRWIIKIWDF